MGETWTLAELVERAGRALAAADVRAPSGRVTEVPDARMVRWYTTTGLLDRPVVRGRVGYYGERHLLQLVAVKRLQAQGLTLAEIQQRLAGARPQRLRELAELPTPSARAPLAEASSPDGYAARPASRGRARFWADRPSTAVDRTNDDRTNDGHANDDDATADHDGADLLYGVRIGGAVVLLPVEPDADDVAAIRAAARPLRDVLVARGLLNRPTPQVPNPQKGGPS